MICVELIDGCIELSSDTGQGAVDKVEAQRLAGGANETGNDETG
jgi:hypothetical protein